MTRDDLKRVFGFAYVHVDINFSPSKIVEMSNRCYDTFRHLAMLIGKPMGVISHGGKLSLSLGADKMGASIGGGYCRERRTMLFKTNDDFCHIAHEWMHSLDHSLQYSYAKGCAPTLNRSDIFEKGQDSHDTTASLPPEVDKALNETFKAISRSRFGMMSKKIAKRTANDYWARMCELTARAFEVYIKDKMERAGIEDKSLVWLLPGVPYPDFSLPEDDKIRQAYDKLFSALRPKRFEGNNYDALGRA